MLTRTAKGVVFAIAGSSSSFLGIIFFALVFNVFCIVNPNWFRKLFDRIISLWEYFASALLELLLDIKVVISGTPIHRGERSLLLMNHRTRLDWLYFWSVLARQSCIHTEKIVLKWELKHVPGAGWAMQIASFIFLNRKWEEDKVILAQQLDYYSYLNHKTQILLFPEGTDFCEKSKATSDRFAKKNNLPVYNNVLHPRTTGFAFMVQQMKKNKHLDAVYDITVGYPGRFPKNELEFITGNYPSEVHFHLQRYDIKSLPATDEGLSQWLQERWQEKEKLLDSFAESKCFPRASPRLPVAGDSIEDNLAGSAGTPTAINSEATIKFRYYIVIVFWTLFLLASFYLLYVSVLVRVLASLQVIFFLVVGKCYGGFELLISRFIVPKNFNVENHKKEK